MTDKGSLYRMAELQEKKRSEMETVGYIIFGVNTTTGLSIVF